MATNFEAGPSIWDCFYPLYFLQKKEEEERLQDVILNIGKEKK